METPPTSFRLSEEAKQLLEKLAGQMGVSGKVVLEGLIREKARREHILLNGKREGRTK